MTDTKWKTLEEEVKDYIENGDKYCPHDSDPTERWPNWGSDQFIDEYLRQS